MNTQFADLLRVLDEARFEPPDDLYGAMKALPKVTSLPLPWEAWALIVLVGYVERQRWAFDLLETRVLPVLARRHDHDMDLEYLEDKGIVPGLPEWEFELGFGVGTLVHRTTGEPIHVGLLDGPGACARWQVYDHLQSHRRPGPAVRRIVSLHPPGKALDLALDELAASGLLHTTADDGFELSGRLQRCARSVTGFLEAWEDTARRAWTAAQVGDWPAAHEALRGCGDARLIAFTRDRADECASLRLERVRDRIARSGLDEPTLHALRDAAAEDLPAYLHRALERPGDATLAALELVDDDPTYVPDVARLLDQIRADGRAGSLKVSCVGYLAQHGYHPRGLIAWLASPEGGRPGYAAVLALEHAPELAPRLLREALRAESYVDRLPAAAAMALVDAPWSRRELMAALAGSDDPDVTIEARAALRESADPEARRAADDWESRHPGHEEEPWLSDRIFYSRCLGGFEEYFAKEMDQFRDRILPMRARLAGIERPGELPPDRPVQ